MNVHISPIDLLGLLFGSVSKQLHILQSIYMFPNIVYLQFFCCKSHQSGRSFPCLDFIYFIVWYHLTQGSPTRPTHTPMGHTAGGEPVRCLLGAQQKVSSR